MNSNQNSNFNPYNPISTQYNALNSNQHPEHNMNMFQFGNTNQMHNNMQINNKENQQTTDKNSITYTTNPLEMNKNDMNFVPFTNNNYTMQNPQYLIWLNSMLACLESINEQFKELLKSGITNAPFIPNPYYMKNINQNLQDYNVNCEESNHNNRIHGYIPGMNYHNLPYQNYPNYNHVQHNMHHNPHGFPKYNPNQNIYPGHPNLYNNQGIDPFTLELLSSMFRGY